MRLILRWSRRRRRKEQELWDDVHGVALPKEMVEEARQEEIGLMQGRNMWSLKPIEDCWQDTGKAS